MAYLAGHPVTEKLANAKRLTFIATVTCAVDDMPTAITYASPASKDSVRLNFADNGATTATGGLTGYAFTSLTDPNGASATGQFIFGVEVKDGLATEFITAYGRVLSGTATNAASGCPLSLVASSGAIVSDAGAAATQGNVVCKLQTGFADQPTGGIDSCLSDHASAVVMEITVVYV